LLGFFDDDDHVYVFVSAELKVCISNVVCVLMCSSARLLFLVFPQIMKPLWGGGHLLSEGMLFVLLVMLLLIKSKTTHSNLKVGVTHLGG
jgi:hypothetical protein